MNDGLKDKYRQEIIKILSQCKRLEKAVLFGSRAMGTFTTTSDVDIALFGEELTLTDQARLAEQMEELTMPQSVDLVLYRTIESKELLAHIKKHGVQWWPEKKGGKKLPDGWEEKTLGDFCPFSYGKNLPKKTRDDSGYIPVFGSNGIVGVHSKPYVNQPGIIIGRKGTVGAVTFSPNPFWPIDTTFYVTEEAHRDLRYTYYLLKSIGLEHMNADSAVPGLNRSAAHARRVQIPPLTEQKAIAHILGSLDDKIELNRRMNETLEAMAQALFKSWFVDFDPVIDNALAAGNEIPEELKEKAEIRKALGDARKPLPEEIRKLFPSEFKHTKEMGWIPRGWRVSTVGEEVEIVGGGTPSTKDKAYWFGGIHAFCTPKDMSTLPTKVLLKTERLLTDKGVAKVSSGQLPIGTVLMSSRAPIGYLAIADVPVTVNQGIIAMVKQDRFSELFLLCWASCNMDQIMARANGSTFLEISKKNFRPIPFLLPEDNIRKAFNNQTSTITKRLISCTRNMKELSAIRDTLLPKLLSGEIRIPEAEKLMEEDLV